MYCEMYIEMYCEIFCEMYSDVMVIILHELTILVIDHSMIARVTSLQLVLVELTSGGFGTECLEVEMFPPRKWNIVL